MPASVLVCMFVPGASDKTRINSVRVLTPLSWFEKVAPGLFPEVHTFFVENAEHGAVTSGAGLEVSGNTLALVPSSSKGEDGSDSEAWDQVIQYE
jgi:hypothetical protein